MQKSVALFALVTLLPSTAFGQSAVWGQCGGIGWTGPTTCVSGSTCVKQNDYYSQCLPGAAPTSSSSTTVFTPTPTSTTTTSAPTSTSGGGGGVTDPNSLHQRFKAKGKLYWGSATDSNRFNNAQNAAVLRNDFGQVTPENSMKWDATEPNRGSFSFSGADATVNFAQQNGLLVRGHTFLWGQQIPGWINNINDRATMTAVIQNHITTVLTRFKGKVYGYDVVNEHINEDGSIKQTPFTRVLGNDAFTIAFQAARAADPNAKLYINDYNLDSNNAKVQGIVRLVNQLNNGTRLVDGIGSQGHITGGQGASAQAALTALAAANVEEIAITELDIANAPSADYVAVARACLNTPKCVGITSWGVRDPDSWRANTNPLLFDANFNPKPAYNAILGIL